MNIQQLRIGNLVRWKYGEDEYNTIHSIDPEQIDLAIVTPFGVHPYDIEGIPLSEEWLDRFGLKQERGAWMHENFAMDNNHLTSNHWKIYFSAGYLHITIKYVHIFQNIIYTLTGEELTLK